MKKIILNKVGDFNHLKKKPVQSVSPSNVIDGDAMVFDEGGEFMFCQKQNFVTDERICDLFFKIKYKHSDRLSGIGSNSVIFGSAQRDPIKKYPGRHCPFNRNNPLAFLALGAMAKMSGKLFSEASPEAYSEHSQAIKDISENWLMPGSVFTSGIINKSNRLIYHTDNGNVKQCFSAMVTMRKNSKEGYLHLPEYDALIKNPHGSLLIFNGGKIIHGVTPFDTKTGSRITIVFYALEGIKKLKANQKEEVDYWNKHLMERYVEKNRNNPSNN